MQHSFDVYVAVKVRIFYDEGQVPPIEEIRKTGEELVDRSLDSIRDGLLEVKAVSCRKAE